MSRFPFRSTDPQFLGGSGPLRTLALGAAVVALAVSCSSGGEPATTAATGPESSASVAPAPSAPATDAGAGRGNVGTIGGRSPVGGELGQVAASATPQYLASAAARTSEVTSGAFTLGVGISGGSGLLDGDLMTVKGVFDTASNRARMTVDGGPMFGSTQMVTAGDTTYISNEGLGATLTAGRNVTTPWIALSSDSSKSGSGVVPFVGTGGARSFLAALRGAGGQVTEVGADTVDGVAVTHYRGTIDPAEAKKVAGDSPGGLADLGSEPVPVEVWIDDQAIVRRLQLSPTLGAANPLGMLGALGGEGAGLTITVELSDLGTPQTIDVPAPDQVTEVEASELAPAGGLGGLGGLGGSGAGGGSGVGGLGGLDGLGGE